MKYCPLWSLFYGPDLGKQQCIEEECGMYGLCSPLGFEQKEKAEEEQKGLKVFGGGHD